MRPPLALLHGVGTNRAVWRRVTPLLAGDRRVAAPDLPGFGAAPPAGPGFALEEVADVLADALEAALAAPFDALGNSLGGAVALVLAERHPERVRRLVLAAPAGLAPLRDPLPALAGLAGSALIAARRRAGPALAGSGAARRLLLFTVMADPARVPAEEARAMLRGSEGSQRIREAITAVAGADLRPRLARLAVPVAFLWGTRDRVHLLAPGPPRARPRRARRGHPARRARPPPGAPAGVRRGGRPAAARDHGSMTTRARRRPDMAVGLSSAQRERPA